MSSRFYSYWFSSALAGLILSFSGCGGGDTQVASTPAPANNTPAPTSNPTPSENAESSKPQVSYGGETPSNAGSGNNAGGGGAESGGPPGRSMGAIGEETFYDGGPSAGGNSGGMAGGNSGGMAGGNSGGMMPSNGMMSGGPPAASGGFGGGVGRGTRNPGTGAPSSGMSGGMGGSYGGESMSSGPMGSGESPFGQNNSADLSMLTTFIQNNCAACHANGSSKGGVNLDRVGPDLKQDAKLWKSVVQSLEESSMPPRNARQPDPTRKAAVIDLIRQALGEDGGETADPSFMERAEIAFRKGERENAMSLFYAALVTASESEAAEMANHFKFYKPNPTKPENLTPANDNGITVKNKLVTELPLAIGVYLKVQTGITDVKPVGVNQAGGAGGGMGEGGMGGPMVGGRGSGGGGGGGAGNGVGGKLDAFEDLTGEVGQAIVSAFNGRRSSGKFGTLFSGLTEDDPSSMGFGGAMNQGTGGFGGAGDASFGEGGLASGVSVGGAPGGRGMSGGPGPGAPGGRGMGGGGMVGGMGPGMGAGMGGDARPTKTLAGKKLTNGLTYIGKADNINSLLKKAQEAGADGLIVVEVEASRPNRNSPIVSNETRFRFLLPSGRVEGASTKTIKNTEVEMGKQDTEFILKQVDAMFAKMDSVLNVIDLPQVPTLAAMKQLQAKIHTGADPLQILAEARMYQVKGIISTDQLETVYQVVLEGNDGIALAKGTEDDRKLVLTSFTEKL